MPRKYEEANLPPLEEVQLVFNDTVGAVLVYLDEAKVGFTLKKAIRAEIYELCDKQIKPLVAVLEGQQEEVEDEGKFNR